MTLPDGTGLTEGMYVLVDSYDIMSDRGHIFAFQLEDGSYVVKRMRLYQGKTALGSDNPEYEPILLHSGIRCRGRVYAVSHDGKNWQSTKFALPPMN